MNNFLLFQNVHLTVPRLIWFLFPWTTVGLLSQSIQSPCYDKVHDRHLLLLLYLQVKCFYLPTELLLFSIVPQAQKIRFHLSSIFSKHSKFHMSYHLLTELWLASYFSPPYPPPSMICSGNRDKMRAQSPQQHA